MHRLYWKIFLAFWLSLVFFVTVTLVAASYYLQQTRARAADENPHERHMTLIREARSIARGEGTAGLERWLAQLDRREVTPYYLLDQQSRDLIGRPLPPDLVFRLGRQRSHLGQMGQMGDMMMRQAMAIRVADGRSFMLVPDFQGVTMWRVLGRPRDWQGRTLAASARTETRNLRSRYRHARQQPAQEARTVTRRR